VTWTVPGGVAEITIEAWGGAGENGSASASGDDASVSFIGTGSKGLGGYASGTVSVTGGDVVTMRIAENGAGGGDPDGGTGYTETQSDTFPDQTVTADAGNGGGSTVVKVESNEVVRAPGGGGGGAAVMCPPQTDYSGNNSVGSAGDANGGGGNGGSSNVDGFYTTSASANGGGGGFGGSSGENSNTASVGENQTGQGAAASGPGGGGSQGGRAGGTGTGRDVNAVAAAAGSGGAGDAYLAGSLSNTSTQNSVTSPDNGTAGQVTISYVQPPDPPSDLTVSGGHRECSLTWTNDPDGYDEIEIYRALTSGGETTADYTLVDTVDGTAESYTDATAATDGERFYYRLRGIFGGGGIGFSDEDFGATNLPAPTNLAHPTTGDESAAYEWIATHNNGETRVEYRRANEGDDWTTDETVASDVESATVDGLLNGEQYESRVVAQTEHAETEDK